MKKLIMVFLIAMFSITGCAYAEDCRVLLPESKLITREEAIFTYIGNTNFILKDNLMVGISENTNNFEYLSLHNSNSNTITGFSKNGKFDRYISGLSEFKITESEIHGFTNIKVTINIEEKYVDLISKIIKNRLNSDKICAQSIISATYFRENDYVGHIFYKNYFNKVATVLLENQTFMYIYTGDINNDGEMELGFGLNEVEKNVRLNSSTQTQVNIYSESNTTEINIVSVENQYNNVQKFNKGVKTYCTSKNGYIQNNSTAKNYSTYAQSDNDFFDYDNNIDNSVNTNTNINAVNSSVNVTTTNNVQNTTIVNNSLFTFNLNFDKNTQINTNNISAPKQDCLKDNIHKPNNYSA